MGLLDASHHFARKITHAVFQVFLQFPHFPAALGVFDVQIDAVLIRRFGNGPEQQIIHLVIPLVVRLLKLRVPEHLFVRHDQPAKRQAVRGKKQIHQLQIKFHLSRRHLGPFDFKIIGQFVFPFDLANPQGQRPRLIGGAG